MQSLLNDLNAISDELSKAVTGNYDFVFRVQSQEPSMQKLCMMINFLVDTIRRSFEELEAEQEKLKEAHNSLRMLNLTLEKELSERKRLESQLIQSQKMESIGQLAAGIAHEINNPIAFVQSNFNSLCKYLDTFKMLLELYQSIPEAPPEVAQELVSQIETIKQQHDFQFMIEDLEGLLFDSKEGLHRVKEIVQGLKTFAHPDEQESKEVDINACLESTLRIVWNELKHKCVVKKEFQDLPLLKCYPGQLNQVFMNLLVNAAQAIKETGEIVVRTAVEDEHIVVAVSDTGQGIASEHLESIFNPFFTTKPVGQGTGLGLSISYGIIQKHQGSIDVLSEIGKGTTFTIHLPLTGKM